MNRCLLKTMRRLSLLISLLSVSAFSLSAQTDVDIDVLHNMIHGQTVPEDTFFLPIWYFAIDEDLKIPDNFKVSDAVCHSQRIAESITMALKDMGETSLYDTAAKDQTVIRMVGESTFGPNRLVRIERMGDEVHITFKSSKGPGGYNTDGFYHLTKVVSLEQWSHYLDCLAASGYPKRQHTDELLLTRIDGDAWLLEIKNENGYYAYYTINSDTALDKLFSQLYRLP